MRYPIIIHKDQDSDYGVTVPDIPGCFSAGDTIDDALKQATESIECHLEGLLLDNEVIPTATDIETYKNQYVDGVWALVDIDLSKLKDEVKRVNITLSERVLAMIDDAAKRDNETRSGFLAKAALDYMQHHSG